MKSMDVAMSPTETVGAPYAVPRVVTSAAAQRCRRRFLRFFPEGFADETYLDWERNYKAQAHERWQIELNRPSFRALLRADDVAELATRAIRIESRTNLLFSFEKMALRDAVRTAAGARAFVRGLYDFLHGSGGAQERFERWCETVASLPRRQTRVLTWPVVTVFPFLAQPDQHIFLKPNVTRVAAAQYGFDFAYRSTPNWRTYASLLDFADVVRADLRDLQPRDLIDVQSFLWVQGSDEYRGRSFQAARTTSLRRAS
jgi:hypothetical protein